MLAIFSTAAHLISGLGSTGDTLRPNKGHVKSASVSSSGPETTTDPLRPRYDTKLPSLVKFSSYFPFFLMVQNI